MRWDIAMEGYSLRSTSTMTPTTAIAQKPTKEAGGRKYLFLSFMHRPPMPGDI